MQRNIGFVTPPHIARALPGQKDITPMQGTFADLFRTQPFEFSVAGRPRRRGGELGEQDSQDENPR